MREGMTMIGFQFAGLNLFAILAAGAAHIVLGLIWFHPAVFGKAWSELTGKSLEPAKAWLVPAMLGHFLMVSVLAFLIKVANPAGALGGALIGLIACAGFVVPMELGELVWEKGPFALFLLRVGNQLLGLAVSGLILGAWR
jgi:hypothetical protein